MESFGSSRESDICKIVYWFHECLTQINVDKSVYLHLQMNTGHSIYNVFHKIILYGSINNNFYHT